MRGFFRRRGHASSLAPGHVSVGLFAVPAVLVFVVLAGLSALALPSVLKTEARTDQVPPASGEGPRFAPYVSAWATAPTPPGVKDLILSFIVADDGRCKPEWDADVPVAEPRVRDRIAATRRAGGDVRVSFGGADGTELATACTRVPQLIAAYGSVIDHYDLTEVDFDIEDEALSDPRARARRAEAIAELQRTHEGLDVSFTLPVLPTGLTDDGMALLTEARESGVRVATVNIMTMNYGEALRGDMGGYAMQAATNAQAQVRTVLRLTDAAAWRALAVTPMVGVNDVAGEVFTLEDAAQLADFAADKRIGGLSMWSAERDRPCQGESKREPDHACSGVQQRPGAYTAALRRATEASA